MRKIILIFVLLIVAMLVGCGSISDSKTSPSEFAYTVVDVKGTVVEMPAKPKRIVTLAASTDAIILGMLPSENLVAINALLSPRLFRRSITATFNGD